MLYQSASVMPSVCHHMAPRCGPMDLAFPPSSAPSFPASSLIEMRLAQLVLEARIQAQARMANLVKEEQQLTSLLTQTKRLSTVVVGGSRRMALGNVVDYVRPVSDEGSVSSAGSQSQFGDRSESMSPVSGSRGSPTPTTTMGRKVYVDTIRDTDILCGRGGRSNHHSGNKRYRHVISEMRQAYKTITGKGHKTDLSRAIVDHVCSYGGRFIKREESTGRYFVLSKGEARKKTSQALRESKTLKWTI
jgi:hypothetical protein